MKIFILLIILYLCKQNRCSQCFCVDETEIDCGPNADSYSIHSLPCVRSAMVLKTAALDICTLDILLIAPQLTQINVTNGATDCVCYCDKVLLNGCNDCPTTPPPITQAPVGMAVGITAAVLIVACLAVGIIIWKRHGIMNKLRSIRYGRMADTPEDI